MTIHPKVNTGRLQVSRKGGGRELVSVQDIVVASIKRLKDSINKHKRLITAIGNNTENTSISRKEIIRKQKLVGKRLYGHFQQQTNKITYEKTWTLLRKGKLKRGTESLLIPTQNNVIKTSYIKAKN